MPADYITTIQIKERSETCLLLLMRVHYHKVDIQCRRCKGVRIELPKPPPGSGGSDSISVWGARRWSLCVHWCDLKTKTTCVLVNTCKQG